MLVALLARRFDEDIALLGEMLALVPPGMEQWRPPWPASPNGDLPFTVIELAEHLLMAWGGVNGTLHKLHPEALSHWKPPATAVATLEAARERLKHGRALTREGFALMPDADLARRIPSYFAPEGSVALDLLWTNAKHVHHHAYQLFVYLKLMGVAVETRHLYRFAS